MLSINKVHIIGNLTRDPEIKDTANGRLARLGVATNRRYRDKDGQMQDATQFHDVVVFQERLIDVIENYCEKGTQVSVEGTLEHRSYEDKDGIKRNVTEIVIRPYGGEFQLGNRAGGAGGGDRDGGRGNDRGGNRGYDRDDNRGGNRGGGRDYDDDRRNDRNDNRNSGGGNRGGGRGNYDDDMDDDIPF